MNSFLFITAIFCALAVAGLTLKVAALQRSTGKNEGFLEFYRLRLDILLSGERTNTNLIILLHYLLLHLLFPLLGFGLFLTTDVNFLVFIATIFWSLKLYQRIYPATEIRENGPN